MKCVYPGSFDPITLGHLNIIERLSKICEHVYVAILNNSNKQANVSIEDRLELINETVADMHNISVISWNGLLVDCISKYGADVIARGIRNGVDYETEFEYAKINKKIGGVETVFIPSESEYCHISSGAVRELISYNASISGFVPQNIEERINLLYKR